jgi:signal transduction histidine kinase
MGSRLASEPEGARGPAGPVPALVLAIGLVVTGAGWWGARDGVRERREQRLDTVARGARTAVQRQVTSYAEALFGLRSLFAVDPEVSRRDFHDAVTGSDIFRRFPGALGLTFDRALRPADKATFEAGVRADSSLNGTGYPDFAVHPASAASDLFVVDYVEPLEGNEEAFGFDAGVDPVRRVAAEEARDSGDLAATAPLDLIQGGRGFLLFLATYHTREPPVTPPARRRHFVGLVVAAFETETMLGEVLGADPRLDIGIYDVGLTVAAPRATLDPASLVFGERPHPAAGGGSDRGRGQALDLDVGTRRWRMLARPGVGMSTTWERSLPWVVLAAGIVLSGLLSGLIFSFGRSRRLAVALAYEMTVHLRGRERELREANERLAEADRVKSAFLGTISHELQTPLTSIRGFSRLLLDDASLHVRANDLAGRIARNADALSRLIAELLEFSRLERGEVSLVLGPVELTRLVPEIVDQLETVLDRHRLRLEMEPGVMVRADPHAVTRILTNMLVNAVKFAPLGTEVLVSLTSDGADAKLSVLDEGPGVAQEDQPKVFDRFFRGSGPAAASPGTGIGLAVVRELAQRMGGSVAVANRPSGGARFTVDLPLYAPGG